MAKTNRRNRVAPDEVAEFVALPVAVETAEPEVAPELTEVEPSLQHDSAGPVAGDVPVAESVIEAEPVEPAVAAHRARFPDITGAWNGAVPEPVVEAVPEPVVEAAPAPVPPASVPFPVVSVADPMLDPHIYGKPGTIVRSATVALANGATVAETLAYVRDRHPGCSTQEGSIRWYSAKLSRLGVARPGVGRRAGPDFSAAPPAPPPSQLSIDEADALRSLLMDRDDEWVPSVMTKLGLA